MRRAPYPTYQSYSTRTVKVMGITCNLWIIEAGPGKWFWFKIVSRFFLQLVNHPILSLSLLLL